MPADDKMNPDVKAAWTSALRSKRYRQGKSQLRGYDGPYQSHCCLGVLCDLAVDADVLPEPRFDETEACYWYGAEAHSAFLPPEVREWAGIKTSNAVYYVGEARNLRSLVTDNDDGATFTILADTIDREF